jgi:hypothetical protein
MLMLLVGAGPVAADEAAPLPPFAIAAVRDRLPTWPEATSTGPRWRLTGQRLLYADARPVYGPGIDPAGAEITTRVGVEWMSAKPRLGLQHGSVGFQLDSGYRMSLRTRHGGFALYLRGKF